MEDGRVRSLLREGSPILRGLAEGSRGDPCLCPSSQEGDSHDTPLDSSRRGLLVTPQPQFPDLLNGDSLGSRREGPPPVTQQPWYKELCRFWATAQEKPAPCPQGAPQVYKARWETWA